MMPQDISAAYDGFRKRFLIEHILSFSKGGLVLARHDDTAKEWGALVFRALLPSAITNEPKTNSRTVQGDRTKAVARQESAIADCGAPTVEEGQWGRTVNVAAILVGIPGQVQVPAELR